MKNHLKVFKKYFTYCGGYRGNLDFFSGKLTNINLSSNKIESILSNLIMANGTRKTTYYIRTQGAVETVLRGSLFDKSIRGAKCLEIGSSYGYDSISNYNFLSKVINIEEYFLGDLYTKLFYDENAGLVYDEDGKLIQALCKKGFINFYFEYKYKIQIILNLHKWIHAKYIKMTSQRENLFEKSKCSEISLFLSNINFDKRIIPLRMNLFSDLGNTYDIIICMHLLIPRYFSKKSIHSGLENLKSHLNKGGLIIFGTNEDLKWYYKD